jgi:hypothetical protein
VDQRAVASLERNKRHKAATLQYLHHSGRMLCPEVGESQYVMGSPETRVPLT